MRIGARGSDLAQWQARWVEARLTAAGFECRQVIISTLGDRVRDRPLNQLGAKGVFTKEIEDALLRDEIDVAVHSFKDMALAQPPGLDVIAISQRDDPADLLILRKDRSPSEAGKTPVVGTSAVRRGAQLRALLPDVELRDLRGNVPTRLRKLADGDYDAIFLASAGVRRLGLDMSQFEVLRLEPELFVPSPAQGALAVQMRTADANLAAVREAVHHAETAAAVAAERSLLAAFGGGCSLPLGGFVQRRSDGWAMVAFWDDPEVGPRWEEESGDEPTTLMPALVPRLKAAAPDVAAADRRAALTASMRAALQGDDGQET